MRLATTSVNPWIPRTSPSHPLGSGSFSVSSPTMGLRTPRFRFSLQLVLWTVGFHCRPVFALACSVSLFLVHPSRTLPSSRHVNSTAMVNSPSPRSSSSRGGATPRSAFGKTTPRSQASPRGASQAPRRPPVSPRPSSSRATVGAFFEWSAPTEIDGRLKDRQKDRCPVCHEHRQVGLTP